MDYYNFNPDFEDSLAFFSPVAQRNTRLSNRVLLPEFIRAEDVHYMRSPCLINQRNQKPFYRTHDTAEDREIRKEYSTESIRYKPVLTIPKHRPVIRVTVTPNNHISTQANLRKRRSVARKVQSTSSNHESFFQAKNVFLFVATDKKEKVYEIKTTGSEYSTKHHSSIRYSENEDIKVERNFTKLLNSLNMDKKKKKKGKQDKNKNKGKDCVKVSSAASLMDEMAGAENCRESLLRECMFSPQIETVSPQKSRVRISGKIGLTEDHRYVMKCDATVDGKPVESNFFQEQNRFNNFSVDWKEPEPREIPRVCKPCPNFVQREQNTSIQREIPKVCQRDEMVQCNCEQDLVQASTQYSYRQNGPAYKEIICPSFRSVETQYSPPNVTVMCVPNIENPRCSRQDEVVQCNCTQDVVMNAKNIGIDVDFENKNTQNGCNNPLVIISVYPKQDPDDKIYEEENAIRETTSTQQAKPKSKKDGKGDKKKGKRSPSPSPSRGKEDKKVEKPKGKGKGKDTGDKKKPAKGNKKGGKKDKPNQEEKKSTESKSPERRPSGTQFGITVGRCAECCMGCVGSGGKGNPNNPQGAAQFRTKRMMNWVSAKNDVSNVAINIDGENEFYDVLFRQGNITTDLQVRKTLKEAQAFTKQFDHGSLENFLFRSCDDGRKIMDDPPIADNTETLDPTLPRISVRDSIEISHRREEKNSSSSLIADTSSSTDSSHINLGNKHFRGDKCNLPNPAERDREIRELLGVDLRASPSRNDKELAPKAEVDRTCSVHCFYRRPRKSDVKTLKNEQELRPWLYMENSMKPVNEDIKTDHLAKNNAKDVDFAVECSVCKDTEAPVVPSYERSPSIFLCESVNQGNHRREIFTGQLPILKTNNSSAAPNKRLEFKTPGKSTFAYWYKKKESGGKKDCILRKLSPEQCINCDGDECECEVGGNCKFKKHYQPSEDLKYKESPRRLISHENWIYSDVNKPYQPFEHIRNKEQHEKKMYCLLKKHKQAPNQTNVPMSHENKMNSKSIKPSEKHSCKDCLEPFQEQQEISARDNNKAGFSHERKPTALDIDKKPPYQPSEDLRYREQSNKSKPYENKMFSKINEPIQSYKDHRHEECSNDCVVCKDLRHREPSNKSKSHENKMFSKINEPNQSYKDHRHEECCDDCKVCKDLRHREQSNKSKSRENKMFSTINKPNQSYKDHRHEECCDDSEACNQKQRKRTCDKHDLSRHRECCDCDMCNRKTQVSACSVHTFLSEENLENEHKQCCDCEMCNRKPQVNPCGKQRITCEGNLEKKHKECCDCDMPDENPDGINQQLILNRNINIYLQIEQFTKQKPIILSRKQYEKVKQVIECAIKKRTTGISKKQSSGKICTELKRKILEKNPEISMKNTRLTCSRALNKEKNNPCLWGKNKTNANKCHEPTTYTGKDYCASDVSFFSSKNEGLVELLKRSIVEDNNRQTQTAVNTFTACSKQGFETANYKLRKPFTNSKKPSYMETGEYYRTNKTDYAAKDRNLKDNSKKYRDWVNPKVEDSRDLEVNQHKINKLSGNTKLVNEDFNYKSEARKCAKPTLDVDKNNVNKDGRTKKLENTQSVNKDGLFDADERQKSKKTIMTIKSKLNEKERKLKTDSANKEEHKELKEKGGEFKWNRFSTIEDQCLEEEVLNTKPKRCAHQEKECTKDRKSRVRDKRFKRNGFFNKPTTESHRGMDIESVKSDLSQCYEIKTNHDKKPHYCKHCGQLKELHSCAICGTLNGRCIHTCYCCNIQEHSKPSIKDIFIKDKRQYAASSTEVRYTSVIYRNYKHVTFSSENVTNENVVPSAANLLNNSYNSNSLHTIFKGRRKTPTPNLGTSSYSLYSGYSDATSTRNQEAQPMQDRKPLLRRLISLLIMRTKISQVKIDGRKPSDKIISSSVDSYNINTSLGAIEMSSSIYDTSASFYSNHSIQPVNSKHDSKAYSKTIKRGFLSSVREFLAITNKKT